MTRTVILTPGGFRPDFDCPVHGVRNMKKIVLDIDETTLQRAEVKANSLQTTVGNVVSEYLQRWAEQDSLEQARNVLRQHFASPPGNFAVGVPDGREQRNARD